MEEQIGNAPALVRDEDGNVYAVGADGGVEHTGQYDDSEQVEEYAENDDIKVTFSAHPDAKFAFDEWDERYEDSRAMKEHYIVGYSAKAITPGEADKVLFNIEGGDADKLKFVNTEGFVFNTEGNTLTLAGGPSEDAQIVHAVYEDGDERTIVGRLMVPSYSPKTKKVVIVPVQVKGGFQHDEAAIRERLNEIYGPVGVTYEVEIDHSFNDNIDWCTSGPSCEFKSSGSALTSNDYTGDEAAVRDAYIRFKGEEELGEETAYLFAVEAKMDEEKTGEGVQGKMQFGRQFGFLYMVTQLSTPTIARNLGHELGHGNYKLYHTFEKMYLGINSRGNTDNLMDYNNGLALNKLQWDIIHEPGVTWGIFARDEDQEIFRSKKERFCEKVKENRFNPSVYENFAEEKGVENLPKYDVFSKMSGSMEDKNVYYIKWLAYRIYCEEGINVSFIQHGRDLTFCTELSDADYTICFSNKKFFNVLVNDPDNQDFGEQIKDIGSEILSNDRTAIFCALQHVMKEIAVKYGLMDLVLEPNCPDEITDENDRSEEENDDYEADSAEEDDSEDDSEENPPEVAEILWVRTIVDMDGDIEIVWKANGASNDFQYKTKGTAESNYQNLEPEYSNEEYRVTILATRMTSIDYVITTSNSESGEDVVISETGNFQGSNKVNLLCEGIWGGIGKAGDDSTYEYLWTDLEGNIPSYFNNQETKSTFNFPYTHNEFKLTRTHKGEKDIVDEAVVLIDPIDECNFEIQAIDKTPPSPASREVQGDGKLLEIVYKNDEGASVELIDHNDQQPGQGYPDWKINGENFEDSVYEIEFDESSKGDYDIDVTAFDATKGVQIKVYDLEKESCSIAEANDPKLDGFQNIQEVCERIRKFNEFLDDVKERLDPIEDFLQELDDELSFPDLHIPVECNQMVGLEKYNAEVYGKPVVVKDIDGTITNNIHIDAGDWPLGPFGSVELNFSLSPIEISYDARNRMKMNSELEFLGGVGTGNVIVCFKGDLLVVDAEVCASISLFSNVSLSSIPGCDYEMVIGLRETSFDVEVKSKWGLDNSYQLFTLPGYQMNPFCIIKSNE